MKEIITNYIKNKFSRSVIDSDVYISGSAGRICYEKKLMISNQTVIKVIVRDNPYYTKKFEAIPWEIELFQYEQNTPDDEITSFINWLTHTLEMWDEDRFNSVLACFYCVGGENSTIVKYLNMQLIENDIYYWKNEFSLRYSKLDR